MKHPVVLFKQRSQVGMSDAITPPPGPDEIQIRTEYSVISAGTEGHCLAERFSWQPTPFPCVPGYQRIGIVESVGAEVTGFVVGERVAASISNWSIDASGVNGQWGAHAMLSNSPSGAVYHLPAGTRSLDAAGIVVAQVGFNAASRPTLQENSWVLVMGDGLIGQAAAQAARARGSRVILVGRRKERLELGIDYSADSVINASSENVVESARGITGQQYVAAVLDSIQGERVQADYIDLLQPEVGQIVYCGNSYEDTWANMATLQKRELTAYFVSGFTPERINSTLALLADGKMTIKQLITHTVTFQEAPDMYRMIVEKNEPFLGIVLDWTKA